MAARRGSAAVDSKLSLPESNLPACIGRITAECGAAVRAGEKILSYYYYKIEQMPDRDLLPVGSRRITLPEIEADALLQERWAAQGFEAAVGEADAGPTCLVLTKMWADFEAGVDGEGLRFTVKPGEWVRRGGGAVAVVRELCGHDVQYLGMCALCGKDVSTLQARTPATVDRMRADIAMAHDETRVTVSKREAERLDHETAQRLQRVRKLSLILDLDQTLIHAAVDPTVGEWKRDPTHANYAALQDVHEFVLPDSPCVYYIKVRPHAHALLAELVQLFELHVYTMGTRTYANAVAQILDPDGALFKERILSRDESGSITSKSLQRLFPCDQSMVMVLDDRADVWRWSPNLLNVTCYNFFAGVGDINSELVTAPDAAAQQEAAVAAQLRDRPLRTAEMRRAPPRLQDRDDELAHVQLFLRRVHAAYYDLDGSRPPRAPADVRVLVPLLKHRVLSGCRLLFSGLFPLGTRPAQTPLGITARLFGAQIADELDPSVTHLVATRAGTRKIADAYATGTVHIVTAEWLRQSIARYARQSEQEHLLDASRPARAPLVIPAAKDPPGLQLPTYAELAGSAHDRDFPRDFMSPVWAIGGQTSGGGVGGDAGGRVASSGDGGGESSDLTVSQELRQLDAAGPPQQLEAGEWDELIGELGDSDDSDDSDDPSGSSESDGAGGDDDAMREPVRKRQRSLSGASNDEGDLSMSKRLKDDS